MWEDLFCTSKRHRVVPFGGFFLLYGRKVIFGWRMYLYKAPISCQLKIQEKGLKFPIKFLYRFLVLTVFHIYLIHRRIIILVTLRKAVLDYGEKTTGRSCNGNAKGCSLICGLEKVSWTRRSRIWLGPADPMYHFIHPGVERTWKCLPYKLLMPHLIYLPSVSSLTHTPLTARLRLCFQTRNYST